ncbi:hypothetical protein BJV77DRAFT_430620 [Russula vinacea]|nr:hypothetical protein BJV77DRAFT_430620 [Russula vinacea]
MDRLFVTDLLPYPHYPVIAEAYPTGLLSGLYSSIQSGPTRESMKEVGQYTLKSPSPSRPSQDMKGFLLPRLKTQHASISQMLTRLATRARMTRQQTAQDCQPSRGSRERSALPCHCGQPDDPLACIKSLSAHIPAILWETIFTTAECFATSEKGAQQSSSVYCYGLRIQMDSTLRV